MNYSDVHGAAGSIVVIIAQSKLSAITPASINRKSAGNMCLTRGNGNLEERHGKNMKQFHVETPEQLRNLGVFLKSGDVEKIATVWSIKLRKSGKSPWDNAIHVVFSQKGRSREAGIIRRGTDGNNLKFAGLKYNAALGWCSQNLKQKSEV